MFELYSSIKFQSVVAIVLDCFDRLQVDGRLLSRFSRCLFHVDSFF